jgi:hypothetical protein
MSDDGSQAAATRGDPGRGGLGRAAATTDGPMLLLVDDDAPLRRSLQRAMERRGFQVYAAESLQAGLTLAHTGEARVRGDRPPARGRQRARPRSASCASCTRAPGS